MINALLTAGLAVRCYRLLDSFPARQKITGYFQSQEGEWDSNGQVLWIMERFRRLSGRPLSASWLEAVYKGADWIGKKRLKSPGKKHDGLLPAGFSAEHFGPNDYYYWDDFWAEAGLRSAARLAAEFHSPEKAAELEAEAGDLAKAIQKSLDCLPREKCGGAIPASPYRRMDSGAVGVLVADYPLQLTGADDPRIKRTVDYLYEDCFINGGFFQNMVHSGINIYLTLAIAQTMLRQGDPRHREIVRTCADLASPPANGRRLFIPFPAEAAWATVNTVGPRPNG